MARSCAGSGPTPVSGDQRWCGAWKRWRVRCRSSGCGGRATFVAFCVPFRRSESSRTSERRGPIDRDHENWPEGGMDDTHPVPAEILDEMAAYYCDRAPEYNAWFERRGNYDQGEAENARWFAEV